MSKSKDYTIETVLSSSQEYGSGSVDGRIVTSQAPFGLRPYMARFRNSCVPYMAGPTTALGYGLRNCDPTIAPIVPSLQTINLPQIASTANVYTPTLIFDQTITLPQIASTANVYTPTLTPGAVTISLPQITSTANVYTPSISAASLDVNYYTQIIETSNSAGTTPLHVGSVYLAARTYTTMSALVNELKYGGGGKRAYVELKRYTNGVSLVQMSAVGAGTYQNATATGITVSTADWYDIYISGTDAPSTVTNATSSIRGFYYEY
tara:strand:- start:1699 stop:2493 length:795 start_codon:yes stop_codon:yes gene_type:complete